MESGLDLLELKENLWKMSEFKDITFSSLCHYLKAAVSGRGHLAVPNGTSSLVGGSRAKMVTHCDSTSSSSITLFGTSVDSYRRRKR